MTRNMPSNFKSSMQTSPWIILGSTVILLIVVIVLAVQNTDRQKNSMITVLKTKGAALIRAVEAGARTGVMGMMWGGRQIQRLLEETGRLPDVKYMAVVNEKGIIVAHSDPAKVNTFFRQNGENLVHLGPDLLENWELVDIGNNEQVFEVHRHFRPLFQGSGRGGGHMQGMMHWHGRGPDADKDWFAEQNRKQLLIVVGLDITTFQQAIREDIRTTAILSITLLLLGFGGFVSLFWMNSYRVAKRTLADTSAFADEVVTHLPIGLIATDSRGKITFFNAAAKSISGIHATQAIGHALESVLPIQLCGLRPAIDDGKTITEKELECTFTSGRTVPLSVSATRIINVAGDMVGHIFILRDLGEIHRLQEEVRRQEKLAAIGGLAAGVAHEIRNPLSSIKGLATFFGSQFDEGSEAKEAAAVMVSEVDRLNRVITELLDFSRPTDIKRQPTDLKALLSHSIQLIQQDTANNDIQINLRLQEEVCPVLVDPDRLSQCLLNLYLNAIQAMDNGGTLTVGCESAGARKIRISIGDTGKGIPPEHLNKIFDPYFTSKNKGTGLGLAIVHKIIEAHDARINVESTLGKGTTVYLQLPCQLTE